MSKKVTERRKKTMKSTIKAETAPLARHSWATLLALAGIPILALLAKMIPVAAGACELLMAVLGMVAAVALVQSLKLSRRPSQDGAGPWERSWRGAK
jgi:hypothetical protein